MIDWNQWKHALAMTESNDNPHAWGDSGQALGRWQMHPAFVWDYGPDTVGLADTWDFVADQTLWNFFQDRQSITPDPLRLAMEFHLGVHAVAQGQWDTPYAERFTRYYAT